jgi:hypothetical protein
MTTAELDALVVRANRAGHNSIAEYALALERTLRTIADANSGVWTRMAHDTLHGKEAR